jgi:hypothetical protein
LTVSDAPIPELSKLKRSSWFNVFDVLIVDPSFGVTSLTPCQLVAAGAVPVFVQAFASPVAFGRKWIIFSLPGYPV